MEYVKSLDNGHRESDLPALSNRRHVAQALIGQRHFIYSRIGHSQREMELLSDGRIGRGSDTCEQEWTVEERGGRTGDTCDDHAAEVNGADCFVATPSAARNRMIFATDSHREY